MLAGKILKGKFKGYFFTNQALPFLSGQVLTDSKKHIVNLYSGELSHTEILSEYKPEEHLEKDGLLLHNVNNIEILNSGNQESKKNTSVTFGQIVLKNIEVTRSWEKDGKTYGILEADLIGKVFNGKNSNNDIIPNDNNPDFFNSNGCLQKIWEYLKWVLLFGLILYLLDQCEGCKSNRANDTEKICCSQLDSLKIVLDSLKQSNKKQLDEKRDCEEENERLKKENDELEASVDSLKKETKEKKLKEKIGDYSNEVYFYGDSDKLREYSEKELNKIVNIMKKYPELKVKIVGHINGTDPKHKGLDKKRADRAKSLLISRGISSKRIISSGGGSNPIVDDQEYTTDSEGNRYNRNMRAIIKIYEE
jgi:outer membrane protein OmpA-like peptidoglycan-associated protein